MLKVVSKIDGYIISYMSFLMFFKYLSDYIASNVSIQILLSFVFMYLIKLAYQQFLKIEYKNIQNKNQIFSMFKIGLLPAILLYFLCVDFYEAFFTNYMSFLFIKFPIVFLNSFLNILFFVILIIILAFVLGYIKYTQDKDLAKNL